MMAVTPGMVSVAGWEEYPWLCAAFSTRSGGLTSVYGDAGEQNLGWTIEDDGGVVAENRRRFVVAAAVQADAQDSPRPAVELVTLRQIHGAVIHVLTGEDAAWSTPDGRAVLQGDGFVTRTPGVLLGVQTADCVPVLVADTRTRAVGAFHAGWRGTVARIVERGIARMREEFGSRPEDLIAAVGPAIGPCCFAVGEEVRAEFVAEFAYAPELFRRVGAQVHGDLQEANRRQLMDAGLSADVISVVADCTACARTADGRRAYFSHRAEKGSTGRMLSVIGASVIGALDEGRPTAFSSAR